jgi:hypothetical protein
MVSRFIQSAAIDATRNEPAVGEVSELIHVCSLTALRFGWRESRWFAPRVLQKKTLL